MTDEGLTYAAAQLRRIGTDRLLECSRCAALLPDDRAALWRHIEWHERLEGTARP